MTKWRLFDAADFLDSEETITEFLAAAEDPNPDVLLYAIGAVARARGMAKVAADSGLGRESLYKALAPGAHPRYETIQRVLDALGVQMTFTPKRSGES
ncbi:putative antitoxin [Candidatus Burkholderia verschuerenii]|uniref:Putative antitoxin n=1 Tax=Candidatus Burkholderia verschuerenii TaxID=242163 RepID=A0A0L0MAS1_9BURK|nr:addiction module antidote protein [Candidatus Burkholderia verschuerenii]KND59381.1 putative antitoxin [Candidatus Burkholderia verschuerenii]